MVYTVNTTPEKAFVRLSQEGKEGEGREEGKGEGRKEGATGLPHLERNLALKVGLAAKHMIIDREFSLS